MFSRHLEKMIRALQKVFAFWLGILINGGWRASVSTCRLNLYFVVSAIGSSSPDTPVWVFLNDPWFVI